MSTMAQPKDAPHKADKLATGTREARVRAPLKQLFAEAGRTRPLSDPNRRRDD
jgi:hypothetical protein